MATLKAVIDGVDAAKPNAFDNDTKTRWLNEVEGRVQTDVFLMPTVDVRQYTYADDQNTVLLVDPPHDKLYYAYLTARIDFANGEYEKYQNTKALADDFFDEFVRWFARNYHPADAIREGIW